MSEVDLEQVFPPSPPEELELAVGSEGAEGAERPRDPQTGRFVAAEGEQPEGEQPAEGETPAQAEERVYAGKFRSVDDLERGKVEADEHIRRIEQENAQLRAALTPQQAPQPIGDLSEYEPSDLVQIAWGAVRRGDERTFNNVLDELHVHSPAMAMRLAAQREAMPAMHQARQIGQQNAISNAYTTLANRYPDLHEHATAIVNVIEERPALQQLLQQGDPATALETAYALARLGGQGGAAPPPQSNQADQFQAKLQATVATGQSNPPIQGRTKADQERDDFYAMFDQEAGFTG